MKKFLSLLLVLIFASIAVFAQQSLMVKNSDNGLWLEHKVAPKESFFAVGRLYNVHPKSIAAYNRLDANKGLVIGQVLRIPLSDSNFTQKGNKGTPVYYKVGENEGLLRVSSLHRGVTLETLRAWNGLSDNTIKNGDKLVVGFLTSKAMPQVTLQPIPVIATTKPAEEVKDEIRPPAEEVKPKPAEVKEVIKEEVKKETPTPVKEEPRPVVADGFFKYHFDQQVKQTPARKNETVTSGIFKTTSGWLDSKYYLLIDGVQPGTIIKISNPANAIVIYAKVLGEMSGIRQNEGLNIRISSAAAAALKVTEEDKFIVRVNY